MGVGGQASGFACRFGWPRCLGACLGYRGSCLRYPWGHSWGVLQDCVDETSLLEVFVCVWLCLAMVRCYRFFRLWFIVSVFGCVGVLAVLVLDLFVLPCSRLLLVLG